MGDILQLRVAHPYTERYREFLEHWADCADCKHQRDPKGRLRLCWPGYHLAQAVFREIQPGVDGRLSRVSPPADAPE